MPLAVSCGLVAMASSVTVSAGAPAIDAALVAHYRLSTPRTYVYALTDLNGDGIPDAVVLVSDHAFCGSGGCNLAILRGTGQSFVYVSGSTISRAPIRVLREVRHGWKSLSVRVAGGGVKPGDVVMRFNGNRYPVNPTLQPYAKAVDLKGSVELELGK